jgi:quercetin dioxygenase-like cupin family protein
MQKTLILSGLFALAAASAQDPVTVAGKYCKVAFENDYVRVLRWSEAPGAKVPMHEHPAIVSIFLSAGRTRFTSPDGKTREVVTKAGQATWSEPEKHSSENLSDAPGELIQVELKKKPEPEMTRIAASEDSVRADPRHYRVEFQNDRVRVLLVHYGPNERSVMHAHPANVTVFLTDSDARFAFPDGTTVPARFTAGQAEWANKGSHRTENTGAKPLDVIMIELR